MTMTYIIRLRNNSTREVREITENGDWDESSDYLWTEGNFACDCNRAQFFAHAAGEPDVEGRECSDELFTAIEAVLPDGRRIALDDDEPARTFHGQAADPAGSE